MVNRIFVVDDEMAIADILVVILRKSGYLATAFYSARSAIEQAEICCPDLIVSDVVMPEMNGVEMAVHFRERHPACRILLISGHASTVNFPGMALVRGHNFDLLSKPFQPAELLAWVADMSESHVA